MAAEILGEIMDAGSCASRIDRTTWDGVAVYVLWDRASGEPVYCGTAQSRGRLRSHLKKDDPQSRPSSHNARNPDLTAFWQAKTVGWLGVSFKIFRDMDAARLTERSIIGAYGIRKLGGKLFNQRLSG